ncbi:MAG: hypothetical protein ACRERD_11490, partial [Candidatus Binatia bacterium]
TLLLLLASTESDTELRQAIGKSLATLFEVHGGCLLPYFDGQSIDLSLALAAFISIGAEQPTTTIVREVSVRLLTALKLEKWLPIDSDSLDDALSVELKEAVGSREFFEVSTLVPMLGTVSASVTNEETLRFLREKIVPKLCDVNLERWFPNSVLEKSWGLAANYDIGISRSEDSLGETCDAEVARSIELPPEASSAEAFEVVRCGRAWLLAISSRHFRHPLPTWYLTSCIRTATVEANSDASPGSAKKLQAQ